MGSVENKASPHGFTLKITRDDFGRVTRVLAFRGSVSAEFTDERAALAWIEQQQQPNAAPLPTARVSSGHGRSR